MFADLDFQRRFELALGATHRGAADAGEVLATATRITDGDPDSWLNEWTAAGGAAWAAAGEAERARHRVSACAHFQRAAAYYATALHLVALSSEPERERDLWRRQRACWDRVVDLSPVPGERVAIPYEGTSLPGYLFTAPGAAPGEPRPLVIVNRGCDDPTSHGLVLGGAAAAERGYHWMTFDGPGQDAALVEQGLTARPDWEAVLTPVVDAMVTRPDVDRDRLAVVGAGQAGYWVPRALAFEHRFAAAAVDPGVVDVAAAWTARLPDRLRADLDAGNAGAFDRDMRVAELLSPDLRAYLHARAAPYGACNGSRFQLFRAVCAYRLDEELDRITTPLLVTDPEDEDRWPSQSQQLFDRLPGPKRLVRLSADDGAPALRESRVFDWLDSHLG